MAQNSQDRISVTLSLDVRPKWIEKVEIEGTWDISFAKEIR